MQGSWQVAKSVAGAGVREGCNKTLAREVDLKKDRNNALCAACKVLLLCEVDVSSLGCSICGRVANFGLRQFYFAGIISRGSYMGSYVSAELSRSRRNTFEASAAKSFAEKLRFQAF